MRMFLDCISRDDKARVFVQEPLDRVLSIKGIIQSVFEAIQSVERGLQVSDQ